MKNRILDNMPVCFLGKQLEYAYNKERFRGAFIFAYLFNVDDKFSKFP